MFFPTIGVYTVLSTLVFYLISARSMRPRENYIYCTLLPSLLCGAHTSLDMAAVHLARRLARRHVCTFASTYGGDSPRVVTTARGFPVYVQEALARESHAGSSQASNESTSGGDLTGLRVWDAAPLLIDHLGRHHCRLLDGRTVIDLGAGTGAVGLAAAAHGARHTVLSDDDRMATVSTDRGWVERSTLATLADNVALNGSRATAVSVVQLRWGCRAHIEALLQRFPGGFETLLLSDVLYYRPEETYGALAMTVRALAAADASVLLSYKVRHGREHMFIDMLMSGISTPEQEPESNPEMRFEVVPVDGTATTDSISAADPLHTMRMVEMRTRP
jgi:predicted nicotinamide N-methyase